MITYLFRKIHLHDNGVQETEHLTAVSADSEADARTIAKLDDTWTRAAAGTVAVTTVTRTVGRAELTQREIYERNVGHLLEEMSRVPEGYEVVAEVHDQKVIRKIKEPWTPKIGELAIFTPSEELLRENPGYARFAGEMKVEKAEVEGGFWELEHPVHGKCYAATSELSAP